MQLYILIFIFPFSSMLVAQSPPHTIEVFQPVTHANFWATGLSTSRAAYESELAKALLEITTPEFGPFELTVNYLQVNYDRGRRLVADGVEVNFFSNPLPARKLEMDAELDVISAPLLKGLLGYRVFIVKTENLQRFAAIKSYEDLQRFKVGQVNYWADVPIYIDNKLPLVEGTSLESLFFMLSRGRFDYIALSIGEAKKTLEEMQYLYRELTIVPDIAIYYPFPVNFQVSKRAPQLSRRLEKGARLAQQKGSMETLFNKHFSSALKELQSEKLRLFILSNANELNQPSTQTVPLTKTKNLIYSPKVINRQ